VHALHLLAVGQLERQQDGEPRARHHLATLANTISQIRFSLLIHLPLLHGALHRIADRHLLVLEKVRTVALQKAGAQRLQSLTQI
jgi:hypothetical protein